MIIAKRIVEGIDGVPSELMSDNDALFLAAVFNAFVYDFIIRQKITSHLDMHIVYTLPVPRLDDSGPNAALRCALIARAARLTCACEDYRDLWTTLFSSNWQFADLRYPSSGNLNYGPVHEREIRERLAESAGSLTEEWTPACGVHDRLPDRRDTGDRAQLRAEIDAYVAHLYGLSRDDFAYILDTFPVLKRKEMKAFGEFISKRQCLEEYDRLGPIVNGEC